MGHHYTPREYLRGFQCPDRPGMIWMYDKRSGRYAYANIDKVAQKKGYYSTENEKLLNDLVERPANPILQNLRKGQALDNADRAKLVDYIGTMLMRGPWRRRKGLEIAPRVAAETLDHVETELFAWAKTCINRDLVERRLNEFAQIKLSVQDDPAAWVMDFLREPWARPRILAVIEAMTWRIATVRGAEHFLTSDNPVWYDEGRGMNKVDSELVFPIASNVALLASWQGGPGKTMYVMARPALVREVNRRTANRAEQFVFAHAKLEWVPRLCANSRPYCARIMWG